MHSGGTLAFVSLINRVSWLERVAWAVMFFGGPSVIAFGGSQITLSVEGKVVLSALVVFLLCAAAYFRLAYLDRKAARADPAAVSEHPGLIPLFDAAEEARKRSQNTALSGMVDAHSEGSRAKRLPITRS